MKEAESELSGGSLFGKGEKTKTLQPSGLCGVPFYKLLQEAEMELEKVGLYYRYMDRTIYKKITFAST